MKRTTKHTHFTLETRLFIEDELDNGSTITEISKKLFRDRSNVGREVLKHKTIKFPPSFNRNNPCKYYKTCHDFIEFNPCVKLNSSPHVCNGCTQTKCLHVRYYYKAKDADKQYLDNLINSRTKMHYSEIELNTLNNDFYNLVIQTKSIYHSLRVINSLGFNFKIKTIYRQIKDDLLRLKTSDLPRANKKRKAKEVDTSYKRDIIGHTYADYEQYKKNNPNAIEWQMDCV